MATASPVRLLIAEQSENEAHEVESLLRNSGIATRLEYCSDSQNLSDSLAHHKVDLVFCNARLERSDSVLSQIRSNHPDLPILLLDSDDHNSEIFTWGMTLGITDVVSVHNPDRLIYVVKRELHHLCNIHQLSEARKALKVSERRCELLLSNSTAAIAYVHEGMHIYANEDYLKQFGYVDTDDLLGIPLLDLVEPEAQEDFKAHMKAFREDNKECSFTFNGCTAHGAPVAGTMTLSAAEYEDELCTQVLLKVDSLAPSAEPAPEPDPKPESESGSGSESVESNQIDSLVDAVLPARNEQPEVESAPIGARASNGTTPAQGAEGFLGDLEYQFLEKQEDDTSAILMLVQLDNYSDLQQNHGLLAAEQAFRAVCAVIKPLAESYLFAPLSDHCFALAKLNVQEADADYVAKSIRSEVEESLLNVAEKTVRCTVTVCATLVPDAQSIPNSTDQAFRLLSEARQKERFNRVIWHTGSAEKATNEDGTEITEDQQKTLELIESAIENNNFMLLFQPIISLRGDSEEHYEVFLRLKDNDGHQLAPNQFLQLAKEQKMAGKIDRWVILQSIKMLSSHRSHGNHTRLTINLTSNSLVDEEFMQWLEVAIKAARLPSDAVIFQITEEDAKSYLRHAMAFVEGMKNLHCRTSLGRFGLAEDCFDVLNHINVDFVKLDGALVDDLHEDTERRDNFTGMIKSLQSKGKLTIVPMVESATVLSALWQAGANYIQGHYLQEPSSEMDYDFTTED